MVCGVLEIEQIDRKAQEIHVYSTWRADLTPVGFLRHAQALGEAQPIQILASEQPRTSRDGVWSG